MDVIYVSFFFIFLTEWKFREIKLAWSVKTVRFQTLLKSFIRLSASLEDNGRSIVLREMLHEEIQSSFDKSPIRTQKDFSKRLKINQQEISIPV